MGKARYVVWYVGGMVQWYGVVDVFRLNLRGGMVCFSIEGPKGWNTSYEYHLPATTSYTDHWKVFENISHTDRQ